MLKDNIHLQMEIFTEKDWGSLIIQILKWRFLGSWSFCSIYHFLFWFSEIQIINKVSEELSEYTESLEGIFLRIIKKKKAWNLNWEFGLQLSSWNSIPPASHLKDEQITTWFCDWNPSAVNPHNCLILHMDLLILSSKEKSHNQF